MLRRRADVRVLLLAAFAAVAAYSDGVAVAADATDDSSIAASCNACHGPAGEGSAANAVPRLAGISAAYLKAQLDAYADGTRPSPIMVPLARFLSPAQRAQLADHYAALTVRTGPVASVGAGLDDQLALRGRWSQGLPACVQCHGENGSGIGAAFPALSGQPATYLEAQLRAFKTGQRRGDALGLMQKVAGRLLDSDIGLVAAYFAAIPAGGVAPAVPHRAPPPSATAGKRPTAVQPGAPFQPSDRPIPDDDFGKVIEQGREIFDAPGKYAARYVGNDLRCTSCHLDEGRLVGSAPMWAAYVSYPAYRAKNGHVNSFAERLQGCFLYSMNGRAPPLGDPVLIALESYSYWMARDAPLDPNIPGRGYPKLAAPAQPRDAERGARLYARECALCHGASGAGERAGNGTPGFPALWGADSYNWGAGMVSVTNAAAFIKANMPFTLGGTLTEQEAWDLAVFVDGHERPQDPRYAGSVAATRARFHDKDDSLYGVAVDGHLLGSHSPPSGQRPPERVPAPDAP